jgi:DNA-binding protein HU-beta
MAARGSWIRFAFNTFVSYFETGVYTFPGLPHHLNRRCSWNAQLSPRFFGYAAFQPFSFKEILTMNKAELIDTLAVQTGQTKADLSRTLEALLETIAATLAAGGKLQLIGFGTFETQHRAARTGRNPQTGASLEIAEATLPKFTPGKALKDRVTEAHRPKAAPAEKSKASSAGKAKAAKTAKKK